MGKMGKMGKMGWSKLALHHPPILPIPPILPYSLLTRSSTRMKSAREPGSRR
jgi:hypothetical protein